jgi:3-mercaptopropionate dioxygenase
VSTLTVRRTAELDELVIVVRAAIARSAGWRDTASRVAGALRENLPPADLLPADVLDGERGTYRSHRLHVEPDGSFSMVAIAWQPGALTRIHDHVTWCVFGVLAGVEHEDPLHARRRRHDPDRGRQHPEPGRCRQRFRPAR